MNVAGSFAVAVTILVLAGLGGGAAGVVVGSAGGPPEATPPTTTVASSPGGTTAPDRHADLVRRLPTEVYQACRPHPGREGGGRLTSLSCGSAVAGADELLVTQWLDEGSMLVDFTENYSNRTVARCGDYTGEPRLGRRSTWGDERAPLACYVNDNDAAILMWEYPDLAIQVLAVREDADSQALVEWWLTAREHALR